MKIQLSNFTMAYEDTGRGRPILFVHGYPLGRRIWQPQLQHLLGSARILAPDLRGHGDSEYTPGPFTMEQHADDCAEFLKAHGVEEPVILCGLSMGGYASFQFVQKYPERVAGLVLAATRAAADDAEGKTARDAAIQRARAEGMGAVCAQMLPKLLTEHTRRQKPKVVELVERTILKNSADAAIADLEGMKQRPDMRASLAAIDVPTLILHGANDCLIPQVEAEAMRDAIPNAELHVLEGAAHLLNVEQPAAFNEKIKAFYRRVWAH